MHHMWNFEILPIEFWSQHIFFYHSKNGVLKFPAWMGFSHQKNGEKKNQTPLRTQAMLAAGFLQAVVWGDGIGGFQDLEEH